MIEAPLVLGAGCGGVFTFLSAYFSLSLFPFWRAYGDVMPLSTGNRSEKKGGEGGGGRGGWSREKRALFDFTYSFFLWAVYMKY